MPNFMPRDYILSYFNLPLSSFPIPIVSSDENGNVIGSEKVASRAQKMIGQERDYNFILDNCHQFTAGCISGDFENSANFFWILKEVIKKEMNDNNPVQWSEWNWSGRKVNGILDSIVRY